jgi:hypothetical protein
MKTAKDNKKMNRNKNPDIKISISNLLKFNYSPAKDYLKLNLNFRRFSLKAEIISKKFKLSIGFACLALLLIAVSWKLISRPAQVEVLSANPDSSKLSQAVLGENTAIKEATESAQSNSASKKEEQANIASQLPEGLTVSNLKEVPSPSPAVLGTSTQNSNSQNSSPLETVQETARKIIENIIPKKSIKFSKASLKFDENLFITLQNLNYSDLKIAMVYSNGEEVETKIKQSQQGVEIEKPNKFKPGKYTLKITDNFGNNYSQDFTWGVLAININKSIYLPNETAKISLAVLDDRGEMVCDAKVELRVQSSEFRVDETLSTENGRVKVNPQCQSKQFSLIPDYEANYQVSAAGEYRISLTAVTPNGTYNISDQFEVRQQAPFEVERTSATRIFPPLQYPVYLDITAQEDFEGEVKEIVPESFGIYEGEDKSKSYIKVDSPSGSDQTISWNLSLKKGEKIRLFYKYKAPEKSPDFYTLGPLKFINSKSGQSSFEEIRKWQIAVDAGTPTIEQQINIIDQEYSTTSTSYAPTDNSLGLVRFDSSKYNGTLSLKFEGVVKSEGGNSVGDGSSIYCISTSDCKMAYADVTNTSIKFADCDDASCTGGTVTLLDGATGCILTNCDETFNTVSPNNNVRIFCPATNDCKVSYYDDTNNTLKFADCDDATCSIGTVTKVDGYTGCSQVTFPGCSTTADTGFHSNLFCSSGNDCKIVYRDSTNDSLKFADCDDATCSTGTITAVDGAGCSTINIPGCSTSGVSFGESSIYCLSTSDCKISYARHDGTAQDLMFADCSNALCSSGSIKLLDGTTGCVLTNCVNSTADYGDKSSITCLATNDCKISYNGNSNAQLKFAYCSSADCSSGSVRILDGAAGCILNGCSTSSSAWTTSISCPSTDDCKIAYLNGISSELKFADCANADCSCSPVSCSSSNGAVKLLNGNTGCILSGCSTANINSGGVDIFCLAGNDCKIAYQKAPFDQTAGLSFAYCSSATCTSNADNLVDSGAGDVTLGLFNSLGTQVTCSSGSPANVEVVGSGSYSRKRTGEGSNTCAFTTTQLTTGDYTVRLKVSGGTGYVKAARIIIVQSDSTKLTDTQTQIEMGNNQTTTSTTATVLTNPKYYQYNNSKFSGTKTAYFEATLKGGTTTSSTQSTSARAPTTQGTNSPAWTNPQNMEDNEGTNLATGDLGDIVNQETFGFTTSHVPSNATIVGITVAIDAKKTGTRNNSAILNLLNVGTCTSKESTAWTTSEATYTLGGSADTWSCSNVTVSNVTSAAFGVSVQADSTGGAGPSAGTYLVDYVAVTIHYTAPVAETATAELWNKTDGVAVTNGSVATSNSTWTRARGLALSTNWDTSNADDYEVRLKSSNSSATASIANAKIIIEQTDAAGITSTQLVHSYVNTLATDTDSTYTNADYINKFDPANFSAGTFTYYYEGTIKTSAGTGFTQLYNRGDSTAVSSSEVSTTGASYSRQRTAGSITMPASAKDMDSQIKNSASNTTSVSNSWLIIEVSNLSTESGPSQIVFTTSARTITAGVCSGAGSIITIQLQNASNVAANPTGSTVVRITSNSPSETIYSDDNCSSSVTNGDFTFTTSENTKNFYIIDTRKSSPTWTLTASKQSGPDTITDGTQSITTNAGAVTRLVVTLPGQTFTDGTGNSGSPTARTAGSSFNVTSISATDDYLNVNATSANYDNDTRTIAYSGPAAAPDGTSASYTTSVQFTNGQSTTTLSTILYKAESATITATDGGSFGYASSSVTINPGEISADSSDSTVDMDSSTGAPDTPYTVTITLKDTWRNLKASVAAANIIIGATAASNITQPSSATDASGVTTGSVYWTNTGAKTVDVTISNVSLVQNDGSTADVDGKLDDTHVITITIPPAVMGISSGVKIKSGTRLRTN